MINEAGKEKIRQANIANIVRKTKAGKTLTAAELKLIEEIKPEPKKQTTHTTTEEWAQSLSDLAIFLGIDRRQVIRDLRDGAPQKTKDGYHIPSWREWLSAKGRKGGSNKGLVEAINREKLRGLKLKHDRAANLFVEKAEVDRDLATLAYNLKRHLTSRNSSIAARVIGKTAGQVLEMLEQSDREMLSTICQMPWGNAPGERLPGQPKT